MYIRYQCLTEAPGLEKHVWSFPKQPISAAYGGMGRSLYTHTLTHTHLNKNTYMPIDEEDM